MFGGKLRRHLPKTPTDTCAFIFTVVMIPVIWLFEVFVVLPRLYDGLPRTAMYYFHIVAAAFLCVNVLGNLWMILYQDTSTAGRVLPSILKPGWKFCSACEANSPPRAFHCHICDRCILRRDHHCTFTGNCIGFFNQRYYLTLVFYMLIAGIYANIMNTEFVWASMEGFSFGSLVCIIFPFVGFVFGLHSPISMFYSFLTSLCIFGTLLMAGLFAYHAWNALNGQTVFERAHRVNQYNVGWRRNIELTLGKNWYISWIFPAVKSPLPGDGLEFDVKSSYEPPKSL